MFSVRGAIAGLVGSAGFGLLVKTSLDSVDALAKTSDKLGITTEGLAGMRLAAELSGVASNTLDMALQRMVRRLSEAAAGTGEAKDAIKELGLDAQQLAAMAPDEAFQKIAGAMENVTDQSDKVRISFKLFDSEGVALVNTLALGEDGLRAVAVEADALGLSVSRIDAAKIEAANDSFTRLGGVTKGLGNAIAANVSPYITELATRFVDAAKQAGGMSNFVAKAMKKVVGAVGFAADMVRGLQVVWKGLQVVALGAISAIITGLDELNKAGAAALNWIPGINVQPSAALSAWAEESRNALLSTMDEMERLANLPMPSEAVKKWQSTAMSSSIDALSQSLMTEEQRIMESYERRSFMVEEAFQNQIVSEQYKNELKETECRAEAHGARINRRLHCAGDNERPCRPAIPAWSGSGRRCCTARGETNAAGRWRWRSIAIATSCGIVATISGNTIDADPAATSHTAASAANHDHQ